MLIISAFARIINVTYAPFLIFISFHYLIGFFSNITNALFSSSIIWPFSRIIIFGLSIILIFATITLSAFVNITIVADVFIRLLSSFRTLIFEAAPLSQFAFSIQLIYARIVRIPIALFPTFIYVPFEFSIFIAFLSLIFIL